MNIYEQLEDEAYRADVDITNYNFVSDKIKGIYCDNMIALNRNLNSSIEKSCILAEELGHHYTTSGNILDQSDAANRKQELKARLWAYNKQIGLMGLIRAYEHGCKTWYETADFLEVTEEFLHEAVECYRSKYGVYTEIDNYVIYFIPTLKFYRAVN